MDAERVAAVRRFNRMATQVIGALDEEYLDRGRPLGASRLLWEIGPDGTDARTLRARLGLDAGYLSRLLRRLEAEGLVTVEPEATDGRVRTVRLTAAGRREHALLDRRSDRLAWSLVEPLDARRRDQLVGSMMTVERLLTASAVRVRIEDPTSPEARACLEAYVAELGRRFEGGFDPHRSIPADAADLLEPRGVLLVAGLWGEPVGCGALKLHGAQPAEIKRMWVSRAARGLGVGRRLLTELEQHAARRGVSTLRLETNGALTEAISLYRSAGYHEVAAFNDEVYADHWFEKHLDVGA